MTDLRDAARQALEALEKARDTTYSDTMYAQFEVAITALSAALEQPEQAEPVKERDIAIAMLAAWCVSVDENGTGWDDWDEHYKDAAYRPGPLRKLLDAAIEAELKERNA